MSIRLSLGTCCWLLLLACSKPVPVVDYRVMPEPQQIQYVNGVFRFSKTPTIAFPPSLAGEAVLLESYLKTDARMQPLLLLEKEKGDLVLCLDPKVLSGQPEGYRLDVDKKTIRITGASSAGVLHGIQTLRQLLRKESGKWQIQCGRITDYPAYPWRAFMLDEGRYFKGKEQVLALLDQLSALKMNVFHWHLTDDQGWRIEIKKYPGLTAVGAFRDSSEINHFHSDVFDGRPHGGFYTQDNIREVVAYATARHIRVVPEIEMPGHASAAIAAYPWLGTSGKSIRVPGRFGVQYDVFNVAGSRVLQFFEDVLDEVITLFPDPVIHIGGDEVKYDQWKASPMIRSYMREHKLDTPASLQLYFTNNISRLLASKGRRMMGWNEITGARLHAYQSAEDTESVQTLEPGSIVHFWKGDPGLIRQTVEKGYDVVNSYHAYTYLDYDYQSIPLEKAYGFNPMPDSLTAQQQQHVLGLGCQMWGEFIPTVESMNLKIYPRIAAYAESGWSGEQKKDYTRFLRTLNTYKYRWEKAGIVYGPIEGEEAANE